MFKCFVIFLPAAFWVCLVCAQPAKQAAVFLNKGIKFEERGLFNDAIAAYKKAIVLDMQYDSAYLKLGLLYTKINKADSAIIIYKNALKVRPGFAVANIAMGNIYRDIKRKPDEAIANYLLALKTDSTNKETYYSLAWCNNAKGYYREGIKYAVKALEFDNNYKAAYNELGHAYHKLNANEEAILQFKKHLSISVNELPLLYSGYCYIEMKQKEEALKMYEELKKINTRMAAGLKKKIDGMQ